MFQVKDLWGYENLLHEVQSKHLVVICNSDMQKIVCFCLCSSRRCFIMRRGIGLGAVVQLGPNDLQVRNWVSVVPLLGETCTGWPI